jgi:hypothetical protein
MKSYLVTEWAVPMLIVSLAYYLAFVATFGVIARVQDSYLPSYQNYASLMFLPHGVRVVVAWLYGWRSLPLLAPAALLTHAQLYGYLDLSLTTLGAMAGIFCAAFSFWFLSRVGMDFRLHKTRNVNWRDVILAGTAAAVLNAIWTKTMFGNDLATASARFFGDVVGLLVSLFVLMLVFRIIRRAGQRNLRE